MGMNHAGEIRALAAIAQPDIGVVTNVGYAHVEAFRFDRRRGAGQTRADRGADPADGVAVLNADDPRVLRFREVHPGRTITFGFPQPPMCAPTDVDLTPDGTRFRVAGVDFIPRLPGSHGVLNLLAAHGGGARVRDPAGAAARCGATFAIGKMRGERLEHNGIIIWNDCYNSNPEAVHAMLDVLRAHACPPPHRGAGRDAGIGPRRRIAASAGRDVARRPAGSIR